MKKIDNTKNFELSEMDEILITDKLLSYLNITKKELKYLQEKNILKPFRIISNIKYGKTLEIKEYKLQQVNKEKKDIFNKLIIYKNNNDVFKQNLKNINMKYLNNTFFIEEFFTIKFLNLTSKLKILYKKINSEEFYSFSLKKLRNVRKELEKFLNEKRDKIENLIFDFNIEFYKLNIEEQQNIIKELSFEFKNFTFENEKSIIDFIKNKILIETEILNNKKNIIKANEILNLEKYEESFKINKRRKFKIILGPTNSGKTFLAIEELKKSNKGIYLAPLRLLALENYEKLNQEKKRCNLITGEEKIEHTNANLTSSTIETLNYNEEYDIAIIDEIHLIEDEERGSIFTSAIVGVNANNVILLGTEHIKDKIEKLCQYLNVEYEFIYTKRRSDLLIKGVYNFKDIRKGDVFIAFSRKNVLNVSEVLMNKGLKVSTIYGTLSPEVRKIQSQMFLEGKTDVLVSTDAIGMGLNLPCNRIIFTSLEKFDGNEHRFLNNFELMQISGRAGRDNIDGEIYTIDNYNFNVLKKSFNENHLLNEKFFIKPNLWHVEKLSKILETKNIYKIIDFFMNQINIKNPIFYNKTNYKILKLSHYIEANYSDFSLDIKFKLSYSPVNIEKEDFEFFIKCLNKINQGSEIYFRNNLKKIFILEELEDINKNLILYMWFKNNFPEFFKTETKELSEIRKDISLKISKELKILGNDKEFYFNRHNNIEKKKNF